MERVSGHLRCPVDGGSAIWALISNLVHRWEEQKWPIDWSATWDTWEALEHIPLEGTGDKSSDDVSALQLGTRAIKFIQFFSRNNFKMKLKIFEIVVNFKDD